jgi:hypothetical protein
MESTNFKRPFQEAWILFEEILIRQTLAGRSLIALS